MNIPHKESLYLGYIVAVLFVSTASGIDIHSLASRTHSREKTADGDKNHAPLYQGSITKLSNSVFQLWKPQIMHCT